MWDLRVSRVKGEAHLEMWWVWGWHGVPGGSLMLPDHLPPSRNSVVGWASASSQSHASPGSRSHDWDRRWAGLDISSKLCFAFCQVCPGWMAPVPKPASFPFVFTASTPPETFPTASLPRYLLPREPHWHKDPSLATTEVSHSIKWDFQKTPKGTVSHFNFKFRN